MITLRRNGKGRGGGLERYMKGGMMVLIVVRENDDEGFGYLKLGRRSLPRS